MRRLGPLVLALAGALATTGCSGGGDPGPLGGDPGLPEGEVHYVALGDSFTSGPGLDEPRTDPYGCGRSTQNYPAFLADWLDVASYTDVSCAGASTGNLADPQPATLDGGRADPQLEALSEETNLVTLGLGANDFVLYARMVQCAEAAFPCPVEDLRRDAANVRSRVATAVEQVRARAPEALVHVIGYPQILPTGTTCSAVAVPPELLAELDEVADALNDSLREGAEAAGASYVDLASVSRGHDVCGGEQAWISDRTAAPGEGAAFHPNADGMRAAAGAAYEAFTGEEPPEEDRAEPDEDAVVLNEVD